MTLKGRPWIKYFEGFVNENVPIPPISLPQVLQNAAIHFGDDTSITFYQKKWSFKQVYGISEHFAGSLYQAGFRQGDRLAIMLPNTPHYIFSFFGGLRLGGIITQVNPMYVERELEYILQDSGAEYMVVYDAFYQRVKNIQHLTPLKKIIVVSLGPSNVRIEEGDELFDSFMKAHSSPAPEVHIEPEEDTAVLQYTGGTTGLSKGVMLTHTNIVANMEQIFEFMLKNMNDRPANMKVLNIAPMFHILGLSCITLLSYRAGCNQIILPRFDIPEVLETIKREQPFQFSGVPTMFIALNSVPNLEEHGLDSIRYYNSGGAAMPLEQLYMLENRTGRNLNEGYGLSEAAPVTHFNPIHLERKAGSIGLPLPRTDAKVVSLADGEEVPYGEVGELIIKGPQVMKGYWNKPEDTAAVIKDGWLYTGDLAKMTEDGYFYIVDRKKDMIIASGFNVYPREVEEVIYQHPAVQEVVVIGIPDEYRGETVKAYIAPRAGSQVTEDEIISYCKQQLAAYKVPRFVEFRQQLPKSAVGKLLKRTFRDEELKKLNQQVTE
ncbi:long-chain-fatty-acid--CoA ligase [Brevibacillus sp. SYSU BS000544]|uniref:long-chain-fatty-acid--CoA ligase n=1 Tax=Brevibacillus sp. SYSU BS000544 TaxID=3416443 RepID=UPI003CE4DFF1